MNVFQMNQHLVNNISHQLNSYQLLIHPWVLPLVMKVFSHLTLTKELSTSLGLDTPLSKYIYLLLFLLSKLTQLNPKQIHWDRLLNFMVDIHTIPLISPCFFILLFIKLRCFQKLTYQDTMDLCLLSLWQWIPLHFDRLFFWVQWFSYNFSLLTFFLMSPT